MQQMASWAGSTAQRVNEQSFTELLVPLVQPAYRLACAMLHDAQTAEDVVQEASLIAWRKMPHLHDRSRLRAWFLGIVANECRNARRHRWLSRVTLGLAPALSIVSSEDRSVRNVDVRNALGRLGHDDRLVISLYFYLDMPMSEMAAVAGASVEATRRRLYRAVHRLRPDLEIEEALR